MSEYDKDTIKRELRTMGSPQSDRGRYLKGKLKMLKDIDRFYEKR